MKRLEERKRVDQVEEEFGRMVLFRVDAGERVLLPAAHLLAFRLGCSLPIVREAVQRLVSLGLVEFVPGKGIAAGRLHVRRTLDALQVELRSALTDPQRARVLKDFCDSVRFVTIEALARCCVLPPATTGLLDVDPKREKP